jgi:hypothetical protein
VPSVPLGAKIPWNGVSEKVRILSCAGVGPYDVLS